MPEENKKMAVNADTGLDGKNKESMLKRLALLAKDPNSPEVRALGTDIAETCDVLAASNVLSNDALKLIAQMAEAPSQKQDDDDEEEDSESEEEGKEDQGDTAEDLAKALAKNGIGNLGVITTVSRDLRNLEAELMKKVDIKKGELGQNQGSQSTSKDRAPGPGAVEAPTEGKQGEAMRTLDQMKLTAARVKEIEGARLFSARRGGGGSALPRMPGRPFNASMGELGRAVEKKAVTFLPTSAARRLEAAGYADVAGPAKGAGGQPPEGQGAIVYEYNDGRIDDLGAALMDLMGGAEPAVAIIFLNKIETGPDTEPPATRNRRSGEGNGPRARTRIAAGSSYLKIPIPLPGT